MYVILCFLVGDWVPFCFFISWNVFFFPEPERRKRREGGCKGFFGKREMFQEYYDNIMLLVHRIQKEKKKKKEKKNKNKNKNKISYVCGCAIHPPHTTENNNNNNNCCFFWKIRTIVVIYFENKRQCAKREKRKTTINNK